MSENPNALKHMYDQRLLHRMSEALKRVYPSFDATSFNMLSSQLNALEMKPRVTLIRDEIHRRLPSKYPEALKLLLSSTKSNQLKSFDLWPYTEFIQKYGIDDPEISLNALKAITPLFTSEWAIRPFITRYPNQSLSFLIECSKDKNHHVRRWSSEGTRPRLPWGERLKSFINDPSPCYPILENLKFDKELYVRKSVSNHLNDIAKDNPSEVIKILGRWKKQAGKQHAEKVNWIIHRALRTLIKDGHPMALKLVGVDVEAKAKVTDLKFSPKTVKLGESFQFSFEVKNLSSQSKRFVIDYILHFVKANRSRSPKVFKLKTLELQPGEAREIIKRHPIKKITTREYYAGAHLLEIQINGSVAAQHEWKLKI